ncbi:MAG: cytochrome c biogenesis protein ResB [Bacteroidota bacterium]|nr:cytochrome c biogenesis protein ResB [Bacteroidota bacterium]
MKKKRRKMWQYPWGYRESFAIGFALLIIGFLIELFSPADAIYLPRWPFNMILIVALIAYIIISYRMVQHPVMKWLSSTAAAIASISIFTILVLMLGFIPQSDETGGSLLVDLGLTHVVKSWPYIMVSFYLLIILGYTIVRKFLPFSLKNFAFFLNHAGLFVVIIAASLGSADLKRLNMTLQENQSVFTAYDSEGRPYQMPFALKLLDFSIRQYPPSIGLVDKKTGKFAIEEMGQLIEVEEGFTGTYGDWEIRIDTFLADAYLDKGSYIPSNKVGAPPAAKLSVRNLKSADLKEGWVTSGSFLLPNKFLHLSERWAIAMRVPAPREYSSDIRFFTSMKEYEDFTIKVNDPFRIHGWTIYQTGFDEKMGKWSQISIVEVVRDPWLPVVFGGIFMILLGSLYLVWMGRTKNKKTENELD